MQWKGFVAGIAVTLAGLGVGAYGAASMGWIPANADAQPGSLERKFAHTALDAWMEKNSPRQENPVVLNEQNLLEGLKLYRNNCAGCHGDKDVVSDFGRSFYPPTPQFSSQKTPRDPDAVLFTFAQRGVRLTGMPAFGKLLKEEEIWKTVLFIKHLRELPPAVAEQWKNG